jgi:eukaryotic-like serine/threonine-protein kinase
VSLAAGARLGPYEIVALLGAGGMGEVYKATDTRLGRTVAIKILPEHLNAESDRRHRFEREAKAISALSHPNICTLYDIGQHEGAIYLVMEHLEGETLAQRLRRAALPIRQVIDIGAQIVDALDAAHRRGIVHRDLKPGNVMLTPSGVKLLDFGLAKPIEEQRVAAASAGPTRTVEGPVTDPGAAVGTVAYMSPEQATGEEVDARSDLFSLGVVLYEMATRHQPFTGASSGAIFDAILHKTPTTPVRLNPDTPADLERIIDKALEKDRDLRYQTAADLRGDLNRLKRDSDSGHGAASAGRTQAGLGRSIARLARRRSVRWAAGVCAVVAVAFVVAFLILGRGQPPEAAMPRLVNTVKVTSALGVEDYPSWSPDGRAMVYQSDQSGNWDIWVTQVGSRQAVNRTEDSTADDISPTWSPDGQWIAFFSKREGGGYFVMSAVGGKARKVASWPPGGQYPTAAQWSPDGKQIVYAMGQGDQPWLEILTLATGASRKLPLQRRPINNAVLDVSWSPDGQWLAYARSLSDFAATSELHLTHVSDGQSFQVTDGTSRETSPAWSPGHHGFWFVSNRGGIPDLWTFTPGPKGLPQGTSSQVTVGLEVLRAVASADGTRLALAKGRTVRNVFRAPLLTNRPAVWVDATQLTSDEADYEMIDVSRGGRLVVASDRGGNWDLWTLSTNGGELEQLTTDPAVDAGARWKPDGSEIAFHSSRTGHREIWILPVGGGQPRQLTNSEEESWYPAWSPDGLEVVARRQGGLLVMPVHGGEARRLTGDWRGEPDWSPDGRWILGRSRGDRAARVSRIPASGGQPEPVSRREGASPRWSPSGQQIYFVGLGEAAGAIWVLSVDSRQERPVTALTGRRGRLGTVGLATDGQHVYFLWEESRGDIWVADIVQR